MILRILTLLLLSLFFWSCRSNASDGFPEGFERGSKQSYTVADVPLTSGNWRLDNALIGKTPQDRKAGNAALRIAPGGSATMLFDVAPQSDTVRLSIAPYGDDEAPLLSLWYSTDRGGVWNRIGVLGSTAGAALQHVLLPISPGLKQVRFSIHNDGHGRVDVDDFELRAGAANGSGALAPESRTRERRKSLSADDNMLLGNPSGAEASPANPTNYLLIRPQYTLSYDNSRGIPNWVSWHIGPESLGSADRCNCFGPDEALPEGFYKAIASAYTGTGFDRGHFCPSADRSASATDNAATFLMTNMAPQAPYLNEQTWQHLEAYCRTLVEHGMELYITAGSYGTGGNGKKGGITKSIAGGRIAVPARFWKIIVVLPAGEADLSRMTKDTRIIAVDMPNTQAVNAHTWNYYRTSVAKIEAATGCRFFTTLPEAVRSALREKVEGGRAAE